MRNLVTASIVVVLLVGGSALAALDTIINQQQIFPSGGGHTLSSNLSVYGPGGNQTANLGPLTIALHQTATANGGATAANQHITGSVTEVGSATTHAAGQMDVVQSLDAYTVGVPTFIPTGQNQAMEGDGDATQSQGFQVLGSQKLVKLDGGSATGDATNTVSSLTLTQNVAGAGTIGTESALISGVQHTTCTGGANANGTATADMNIVTAQYQKIG
jgi:hypothetical protein